MDVGRWCVCALFATSGCRGEISLRLRDCRIVGVDLFKTQQNLRANTPTQIDNILSKFLPHSNAACHFLVHLCTILSQKSESPSKEQSPNRSTSYWINIEERGFPKEKEATTSILEDMNTKGTGKNNTRSADRKTPCKHEMGMQIRRRKETEDC